MIKRLTVKKLHGHTDFDLCFHPDMNVLTGRNGCGKTTLLKLAWYMISGNFERIEAELDFEFAELETDTFTLSVSPNKSNPFTNADWKLEGIGDRASWRPEHEPESSSQRLPTLLLSPQQKVEDIKAKIAQSPQGSVFFPTFRRIESGFSINKVDRLDKGYLSGSTVNKVKDAMIELSERLSVGRHRFVASISTQDIDNIVANQYALASYIANNYNTDLSHILTEKFKQYDASENAESAVARVSHLEATLKDIQKIVTENSSYRERSFQPVAGLGKLITQILQQKGIEISPGLTLGDASDAIPSDALSAGEKQMLGFVAYNAFTSNGVIFIDEPEISLHVDWQRILFSVLESQGTNNQFIIATHSPFIYSKYTDKEIVLNSGRGE